jgi:hypothetical protein
VDLELAAGDAVGITREPGEGLEPGIEDLCLALAREVRGGAVDPLHRNTNRSEINSPLNTRYRRNLLLSCFGSPDLSEAVVSEAAAAQEFAAPPITTPFWEGNLLYVKLVLFFAKLPHLCSLSIANRNVPAPRGR